jgi:DNA polymerase sigma
MQYNIGDERLPDPKEPPTKFLNPEDDAKLSGDMRELYGRLLPSEESENRRKRFVEKLEGILHKEWPGHDFKVHVFGSSGNMLCTSESDGEKKTLAPKLLAQNWKC